MAAGALSPSNISNALSQVDEKYIETGVARFGKSTDDLQSEEVMLSDLDLDSMDQSTSSYVIEHEVEVVPDFFQKFNLHPLVFVDEISDDEILPTKSLSVVLSEPRRISTAGQFVDPLTGDPTDTPDEGEEELLEEEESFGFEEDEAENSSDMPEDDDLLVLLELEMEPEPVKKIVEEEVEELFAVELEHFVTVPSEIETRTIEQMDTMGKAVRDATEFLDQIIADVVETCEYVNPSMLMRKQLDKNILIQTIVTQLEEVERAQKIHFFLNRRCVEHFRRKNAFSAICEEQPETLEAGMKKLEEIKRRLDLLLGREEELKSLMQAKIEIYEFKVLQLEKNNKRKEEDLKSLIRETFDYEHLEKMQGLVSKLIRQMSMARKELSSERLMQIQKQHNMATLSEKLEKLEYIGKGLYMRHFESLQTEVQALGKKVEERNNELNRCRHRCNMNTHILAHLKESQDQLRGQIEIQKSALAQLERDKQEIRRRVYKVKLDRTKLSQEIQELSFQSGLLDKPALMLDYDVTKEHIHTARTKVKDLRKKYDDIMRKIHHFESDLPIKTL